MKFRFSSLLIYSVFLCSTVNIFAQESPYLWPTDSGKFLSSTFGETRSAHFHAGLDIKTWGREGYRVFASKDGIASRLSITNRGYGKVIYLKHNDGKYTVYAHLQRFNSKLQTIADSIRLQDYTYTMDSFLESDSIFFKKGDLIGFTGSTGIGPPHLHFEIRDQYNNPLNPLQYGFDIKDTRPPKISSLLFEPINIQSKIDYSVYPKEIRPNFTRNDTTFFNSVSIQGAAGVSINVYDVANSVYNKYAVHELILKKEADTLVHQTLDKFSFEQAEFMFLDRVSSSNSSSRKFQRLFKKDDFNHPFIVQYNNNYLTESGTYYIIAKDFFGNTAVAQFEIDKSVDPFAKLDKVVERELWHSNWLSVNDTTNIDLLDFSQGALWNHHINYRLIDFPISSTKAMFRINNQIDEQVTSPDQRLKLFIPENAFFTDVSLTLDYSTNSDSVFINIGPEDLIVRRQIYLQFFLGELPTKEPIQLYYKSSNGQLSYQHSEINGMTLKTHITGLGTYVLASDTTKPSIRKPRIAYLGNGQKTYSIRTNDELSGIDYQSAVFTINGERGIPEYNYENNSFTFYLPGFRLSNKNEIYFEVKDNAGNLAKQNFLLDN